jgi:cytochrome c-type biogenesis protein
VKRVFGIDLWDASLAPALFAATLGGVLSFLSPCVLPIVPPYLAFMAGASMDELADGRTGGRPDGRVLRAALFFVLGLSTVFLLLAFGASSLGRVLLVHQRALTFVSGTIIVVFGLHFLGLLRVPFLAREARFEARAATGTPFGAYVFGLAFAFGWTPCIGPVLGAILSLAAQASSIERGLLLMGAYALGLGLPFVLTALFLGRAVRLMTRIKPHMAMIERAMGVLLVGVGLMMLTGGFSRFAFWLLDTFPSLALVG